MPDSFADGPVTRSQATAFDHELALRNPGCALRRPSGTMSGVLEPRPPCRRALALLPATGANCNWTPLQIGTRPRSSPRASLPRATLASLHPAQKNRRFHKPVRQYRSFPSRGPLRWRWTHMRQSRHHMERWPESGRNWVMRKIFQASPAISPLHLCISSGRMSSVLLVV